MKKFLLIEKKKNPPLPLSSSPKPSSSSDPQRGTSSDIQPGTSSDPQPGPSIDLQPGTSSDCRLVQNKSDSESSSESMSYEANKRPKKINHIPKNTKTSGSNMQVLKNGYSLALAGIIFFDASYAQKTLWGV